MKTPYRKMVGLFWLVVCLALGSCLGLQARLRQADALPLGLATVTPTRTPMITCPPVCKVYLPVMLREYPWKGISGLITYQGQAISGIYVTLQRENSGTWSNLLTATTNGYGEYAFTSAPALNSGQRYRVVYNNSTDYTKLARWQSEPMTNYTAQHNQQFLPFDVADIVLQNPTNGSVLSPSAFTLTWQVRSASSSDIYQVYFYNLAWQKVAESALLGFAGSVDFNSLPAGLNLDTDYTWRVVIDLGDGRAGESFYRRAVRWETGN